MKRFLLLPLLISIGLLSPNRSYANGIELLSENNYDISKYDIDKIQATYEFAVKYCQIKKLAYKNNSTVDELRIASIGDKDVSLAWMDSMDGRLFAIGFHNYLKNFSKCVDNPSIGSKLTSDKTKKELFKKWIEPFLKDSTLKKETITKKVENKIRKKCLQAKDFEGCMEYERSQQ